MKGVAWSCTCRCLRVHHKLISLAYVLRMEECDSDRLMARRLVRERRDAAERLLERAEELKGVKGMQRVQRKIKSEQTFLETVSQLFPQ